MSAIHYASPGGAANSMGAKTSTAGIWGQAGRNIKAGTAIKPTISIASTDELNQQYGSIHALPAFHGETARAA